MHAEQTARHIHQRVVSLPRWRFSLKSSDVCAGSSADCRCLQPTCIQRIEHLLLHAAHSSRNCCVSLSAMMMLVVFHHVAPEVLPCPNWTVENLSAQLLYAMPLPLILPSPFSALFSAGWPKLLASKSELAVPDMATRLLRNAHAKHDAAPTASQATSSAAAVRTA